MKTLSFRKISEFFMYVCMYVCIAFNSRAQVAPTHPELIMPAMEFSPMPAVHDPYFNSSYSYFDVEMLLDNEMLRQDLYVYGWTGENFVSNGLAWIRRDHLTDAIMDSGYIKLPRLQSHHEVGLIKAGSKVFVAVSYISQPDTAAAFIDFYEWKSYGLDTFPTISHNIRSHSVAEVDTNLFYGRAGRITMDCVNLNKIVVAWNEFPSNESVTPYNDGGIYLKTISVSPTGGFIYSNTNRIAMTDSTCIGPDVAIGAGGDSVYVAYIRKTAADTTGIVEVVSNRFNNIATAPAMTPIMSFGLNYTTGTASTDLVGEAYYHQLRIDAPDHINLPIWSLVWLSNHSKMNVVTIDPLTLNKNVYPGVLFGTLSQFCTPVVVYSSSLSERFITLGWYNPDMNRYLATRLTPDGTSIILPSVTSSYYVINPIPTEGGCFYGGKLSFSTSQQLNNHKYLFMTYPIVHATFPTSDMRTKSIKWNPYIAFKDMKALESPVIASISPNPLTENSYITLGEHESADMSIQIIDNLGRTIHKMDDSSLQSINNSLPSIISNMNSGYYTIHLQVDGLFHTIKAIKK